MVDISHESPQATERRLLEVTRRARLTAYRATYAYLEFPLPEFPAAVRADALALVRDDAVWSQLVPCDDPARELFALFRFHFPAGTDNSGFVGWLASRLKQRFGTGVFVICGHNRDDGGIYDYWGVPAALADEVRVELEALTSAL